MKSIIIVFALIAAASCDVSHIVQGDGWYKDETGYHYTEPQTKFDAPEAPAPAPAPEEPAPAPEAPFVNEIVEEVPVVQDQVVEVISEYLPPVDYLPPTNVNNEYLPPKTGDAKRKRQTPVRRVYRRFLRRH